MLSEQHPNLEAELQLLRDEDESLTPVEIVKELDRYVIAQDDAKKAVAIALRNRWRRLRVTSTLRDEITPKNIIMIGPTGVGKTEIARRLSKLARAPFVKVEATKFTEVGYVGRDVESIIRDLAEMAHSLIKREEQAKVLEKAAQVAEEKILDLLLPTSTPATNGAYDSPNTTREKLRELLREGKLDERVIEVETQRPMSAHLEIMGPPGMAEMEGQIKEMFSNLIPKAKELRKLPVSDARKILTAEAQENLIDHEEVARRAVLRAEQAGIVFIDEIDKICGSGAQQKGPDVSREGVQRDLLPLVEGCTVGTKYGSIRTDHILFIASGAFHHTKPSELMPEFQGRFPIRVELKSLTAEHFVRILTEPKNALTKQYSALLETEGVKLRFDQSALEEIARLTAEVNSRTENIGARRLHTLLEKLLEEVSFSAKDFAGKDMVIDRHYVRQRLANIVDDIDLSRFIL